MTGHAYYTSAKTAARMGPFAGFADNREPTLRVLRQHQEAASHIDEDIVPTDLLCAAQECWDNACDLADDVGVRNSQATVLAPTGCLVGGSLVATDRGLVRLRTLGAPDGEQWQDVAFDVLTDDGAQPATKFYVNGLERVVDVTTERGYGIRGTTKHRIKVVAETGEWVWRRFADLRPGDRVPLALGQLIGEPRDVALPFGADDIEVPRRMTPELAELVGYFMGDGTLDSRGMRLSVPDGDDDVLAHLAGLAKELFGVEAVVTPAPGTAAVSIGSASLVAWWKACGFATHDIPHVPDAVLHTNDPEVYRAFLRGVFDADGTSTGGYPSVTTANDSFADELQTLLLALGFVTTRAHDVSGRGSHLNALRLLNREANARWLDDIGFVSKRKARGVHVGTLQQSARYDHIPVTRELIDRVAPVNNRNRRVALMEHRRSGTITRRLARELHALSGDSELDRLLGFFYDRIAVAELGDEEPTYDLSVPSNVTYVANGFVSHNTIGLMMDCDTTGVEPDLGLVKLKKLVGGGTMSIVNQTVPRALVHLGYTAGQIADIVAHIDEHKSIVGAPHITTEHLAVFACSMGDNTIHYMGHIKMMGAVQPFISGAISKTANMPEDVTVEDVEQLHIDAWRLGVKAIAIYRDNCKVAQPLATAKKESASSPQASAATEIVEKVIEKVIKVPVREKLPRSRTSKTFEFRVADCKGFVNVGEYADGRPGEIFMRISKQGSTLAGIMDAFAISVSYGLQYGVPLRAYVETLTNTRFEPAGMTDDPDLRFATSLVDYIFRRLAVEYLSFEERAELGILTVDERTQPTLPGVEETVTRTVQGHDAPSDPPSIESVSTLLEGFEGEPEPAPASPPEAPRPAPTPTSHADAPYCMQCGVQMQRAGSCHACPSCGSTSGCS
jgi:ribonucleoside-diphosphate reductase alpha chain